MPRDHFQRSCGDVSLEASGYVATVDFEYPPGPADPEAGREMAATAVGEVLSWCCDTQAGSRNRSNLAESIGRRAAALLWAVRPEFWDGRPQSRLAEELGFTRSGFNHLVGQARDTYGFKPLAARGEATRKRCRDARNRRRAT